MFHHGSKIDLDLADANTPLLRPLDLVDRRRDAKESLAGNAACPRAVAAEAILLYEQRLCAKARRKTASGEPGRAAYRASG